MTTVQMPGTNQPIDYDFINQLVNQVNSHDNFISQTSTKVTSTILGNAVVSSKLKIYAKQLELINGGKTTVNEVLTKSGETLEGFLGTPVIIATATSADSATSAGCSISVSYVSEGSYNIHVKWLETKTNVTMKVNILAIGSTKD